MKKILVVLCVLSGCVFRATPSDERVSEEIDKVVCTFDTTDDYSYGVPLTEGELDCLHLVQVVYVPRRNLESHCNLDYDPRRHELAGCYNENVIYISQSLTRKYEILALRHEIGHHLLWCAGLEDIDHTDEIFGGSDKITDGISQIAEECK